MAYCVALLALTRMIHRAETKNIFSIKICGNLIVHYKVLRRSLFPDEDEVTLKNRDIALASTCGEEGENAALPVVPDVHRYFVQFFVL